MNEWINFILRVEKTRGLFTFSRPLPWGKLLLTKDTVSYSMLSTCTFIQFILKWTLERERESESLAYKRVVYILPFRFPLPAPSPSSQHICHVRAQPNVSRHAISVNRHVMDGAVLNIEDLLTPVYLHNFSKLTKLNFPWNTNLNISEMTKHLHYKLKFCTRITIWPSSSSWCLFSINVDIFTQCMLTTPC